MIGWLRTVIERGIFWVIAGGINEINESHEELAGSHLPNIDRLGLLGASISRLFH